MLSTDETHPLGGCGVSTSAIQLASMRVRKLLPLSSEFVLPIGSSNPCKNTFSFFYEVLLFQAVHILYLTTSKEQLGAATLGGHLLPISCPCILHDSITCSTVSIWSFSYHTMSSVSTLPVTSKFCMFSSSANRLQI